MLRTGDPMISNSQVLDTRFRSALRRMIERDRLRAYVKPVDTHLEVAAIMKRLDGGLGLLFQLVKVHDMPVVGNLLCCQENCEAAFVVDYRSIRAFVGRALASP